MRKIQNTIKNFKYWMKYKLNLIYVFSTFYVIICLCLISLIEVFLVKYIIPIEWKSIYNSLMNESYFYKILSGIIYVIFYNILFNKLNKNEFKDIECFFDSISSNMFKLLLFYDLRKQYKTFSLKNSIYIDDDEKTMCINIKNRNNETNELMIKLEKIPNFHSSKITVDNYLHIKKEIKKELLNKNPAFYILDSINKEYKDKD